MEYEHQELRVPPSEVDKLETRLKSEGWDLYRQEGEEWPIEKDTDRVLMQLRRPRK
jgi:hypothetical protein